MSVRLTAVFKDARNQLTMASLRAALDELEAHANVPTEAALKVNHFQQGGWEITATWSPDEPSIKSLPDDFQPAEPWDGLVSQAVPRQSGGFRKIKDNPQG